MAGTHDQLPAASAATAHTGTPSRDAVTSAPGSAVPKRAGVGPAVPPFAGASTTGTAGTTESTVKTLVFDLAASPTMLAVAACAPWGQLRAPEADAVAVHTTRPSTLASSCSPGAAVPDISGVESLVIEPSGG